MSEYILKNLETLYPEAKTELINWENEFQFLICILLSAQTTDIQVNRVTGELFKQYSDVDSFVKADVLEIEKILKSINFYKTKSKHIVQLSKILKYEFDSKVPRKVEDLIKLPGVGKKTANVFLNELFQANQGIPVDVHVARVSKRLGLTNLVKPDDITGDLEKIFEKEDWYKVNTLFVLFGRYHCKARKPLCGSCVFTKKCKFRI